MDILELLGVPLWSVVVVGVGIVGLFLSNSKFGARLKEAWEDRSGRTVGALTGSSKDRLERLLEDHNDFVRANNDAGAAKMMEAINAYKGELPKVEVANVIK